MTCSRLWPRRRPRRRSFPHEVVALGLAENYARAHPGRRRRTGRLGVPLDSTSLAALLVELFPSATVDG